MEQETHGNLVEFRLSRIVKNNQTPRPDTSVIPRRWLQERISVGQGAHPPVKSCETTNS
jgi:hypothetical protein